MDKFKIGDIVFFCTFSKIYKGTILSKGGGDPIAYKIFTGGKVRDWFNGSELYISKAALIAALQEQIV